MDSFQSISFPTPWLRREESEQEAYLELDDEIVDGMVDGMVDGIVDEIDGRNREVCFKIFVTHYKQVLNMF